MPADQEDGELLSCADDEVMSERHTFVQKLSI